jgi:hypothetical protein
MTTPAERPLFIVSGGPSTTPLWPGLAERYDLVFLYPQAAQQAQTAGLRAGALASVVDGDLQEHIATASVNLAARVVGALPAVRARVAALCGDAPPEGLNGHLPEWFPGYAHHLLGAGVAVLAQLDRLAQMDRPIAGCLTHEDVSLDTRALVAWCNARGVPTIHVPHAPCHLLPGVTDIHRETRARWIAASGPAMARFYADGGHDPARIALIGAPQWDDLYGPGPDRAESRRVLLGPDAAHAGPVLAYMTTWGQTTSLRSEFEREFDAGWQAVLAAAQTLGAYLCVLVHWNDQRPGTEEKYEAALRAAGVAGLVTRNHKHYLLRAVDCLVAQGPSNMCVEAAILGTPSCYLQTEGFDYATPLPYRGTPANIGAAIRAALDSAGQPAWQAFIAAYNAAHPDSGATERVLALVETVCR